MARYRFCSFYFAAERLWKALDFHRARKGGQKQEDQIQVQRTFDRRTGELNGSLSVLLVLLRCRTIMESARFSPSSERRTKTRRPNPSPTNLRPQNRRAEWLAIGSARFTSLPNDYGKRSIFTELGKEDKNKKTKSKSNEPSTAEPAS